MSNPALQHTVLMPMPGTSFYRRPLPTQYSTPFASEDGKLLFVEALSAGSTECFFPLIEQVRMSRKLNIHI